jgi:DNA modification methylase
VSLPKPYYQDDAVTLYHGDCREIVPHLGRFDLLLTDPPYGIGAAKMTMGKAQSNRPKAVRFDKGEWDDLRPDITPLLGLSERLCVWGGNYFSDLLPPTNHWLIWHKQNDGRSFSECEMAWTNYGRQTRHFSWGWLHGGETKEHPTQKPLEVMTWCITLAGDAQTILDPFAGSGTTGRAAKDLGRKCVMIELEERYCEIAAQRMRQEVLQIT